MSSTASGSKARSSPRGITGRPRRRASPYSTGRSRPGNVDPGSGSRTCTYAPSTAGPASDSHATGDTGWWDYGDGSPLEPFAADQPTITHTYAKPGSYSVKLVVRNFTSDENERTVAVEAAAAAKDTIVGATTAAASLPR